jgi:MFS transporter, ACS family, glucarate transporter
VYKGGPLWVGAVGCLAGGFLADWLGRISGDRGRGRRLVGVAALAACAGCWLLARAAPDEHAFFLLISGSAFCNDLTMGAAWATCQDIGRRHAAVTAACMNTVGTAGAATAGWLTGTLVERALAAAPADPRAATLAGFDAAFLTYAAAYAVAAVCWLAIDPARPIADHPPEPSR